MNREELKTILPHREPMLLIDQAEKVGELGIKLLYLFIQTK